MLILWSGTTLAEIRNLFSCFTTLDLS